TPLCNGLQTSNITLLNYILSTLTILEIMPATKAIDSFKLPNYNSGKVQYFHDHATVGLNQSPAVDVTAAVGFPYFKLKSFLKLSGEFDTKALDKAPRFRLSLALKPKVFVF
ncbi:hypothetical protein MKW98_001980, partial [Papaver atlanticum]